jgi:ParB family chromosome partitioning protein
MSSMTSSSVLGRGLGSLLPTPAGRGDRDGTPLYVNVSRIRPRPDQPRQHFDEQALRQLAVSIREQGILQPLVVTPERDGAYTLIAGERRLRAAQFAGLTEVPVVVRHADPAEAYELALLENIQREDLNPIEESEAYRRLIDEHGYTQEALARRVGKDRTTVSNALRLLKLRAPLRERLLRGSMSAGHARALLGTDDEALQDELAQRIETEGLSVRAVEKLVAIARARKPARKKADPFLKQRKTLATSLQSSLGRKVAIRTKTRGKGGTVTIAYTDDTDLQRLVSELT